MKASDWTGRRVRARRRLGNSLGAVPAGTELTVRRKYGGLELVTDPCPACGVELRITRVPVDDVELVDE